MLKWIIKNYNTCTRNIPIIKSSSLSLMIQSMVGEDGRRMGGVMPNIGNNKLSKKSLLVINSKKQANSDDILPRAHLHRANNNIEPNPLHDLRLPHSF